MENDNVFEFKTPGSEQENGHDMLTEVLRSGAKKLLSFAVEAEVASFIEAHQQAMPDGRARLVRNGYLPEREVTTGIGPVEAKVPRVRDRDESGQEKIRFESNIIPKYLRRSGDMNELLPLLYLKGLSTGEFVEALVPIVGEKARNLSSSVISRLKSEWTKELDVWRKQDLSKKRYVYWWADGIYLTARMEHEKQCILVIIGVTDRGDKELIAMEAGFRESKQSWLDLLRSLKQQGLKRSPQLAVGDGALGFWGAMNEEFSETRHQRCWFHKMGNVLNLLPKSLQPRAKTALQQIWMASTRKEALEALEAFCSTYEAKYPKAVENLLKDKDELLAFYDFPAEHWASLRTTNPIESTFATVRHRTRKSKGCHSRKTIETMVFKLVQSAQKRWRRLRGFKLLADVIEGVNFKDGTRVDIADEAAENTTQQPCAV
jgi:putative transposase